MAPRHPARAALLGDRRLPSVSLRIVAICTFVSTHTAVTLLTEAPWGRIEQCCDGHLLCAEAEPAPGGGDGDGEQQLQSCVQHVRAVRGPKCPTCRVGLHRVAIRALCAEQTIAALPSLCRHCQTSVPRREVPSHEAECPRAPVTCAAGGGGCRWTGPTEEQDPQATCAWGEAGCACIQDILCTDIFYCD